MQQSPTPQSTTTNDETTSVMMHYDIQGKYIYVPVKETLTPFRAFVLHQFVNTEDWREHLYRLEAQFRLQWSLLSNKERRIYHDVADHHQHIRQVNSDLSKHHCDHCYHHKTEHLIKRDNKLRNVPLNPCWIFHSRDRITSLQTIADSRNVWKYVFQRNDRERYREIARTYNQKYHRQCLDDQTNKCHECKICKFGQWA